VSLFRLAGLKTVRGAAVTMAERYDCTECTDSLYGQKYILRDDDPFCIKCFEHLFSSNCEACQKPINCTSKDLSYKDRHWHCECFLCVKCQRSLVDRPFATKDDVPMCTECYSNEYSSKCHGCLKTIMPGTKNMEHRGNSWHENCFTCTLANSGWEPGAFTHTEADKTGWPKHFTDLVYCNTHHTESDYRDQRAQECFVASAASSSWPAAVHSRDDFAYCLNCFCNVAKKCAHCTTPISGLGGSKYISFEQRQWHNDCFNCKKCCMSLVGRGFLTSKDDILCPDCVKDL
uniref:LIM zinc-binding domain-containing protein n=1 Tax=Gasterosteus aculeatus TaxID=69293 RepID=G3PQG6_GASAC